MSRKYKEREFSHLMQLLEEGSSAYVRRVHKWGLCSAYVRHVYVSGDFVPAETIYQVHRERKEDLIILTARS